MELPKFRAWFENKKVMTEVKKINFWSEKIDTVAFEGKFLDDGDIKLMQSTGIFDKDGVEIFEGDILELKDGDEVLGNAKLVWNKWQAVLVVEAIGVEDTTSFSELIDDISSYRVIGNIYENPELLG